MKIPLRWLAVAFLLNANALLAPAATPQPEVESGWLQFQPTRSPLPDSTPSSPIDLRGLNEALAGEQGFIEAKDGMFRHSKSGKPVRFWAVNGPPSKLNGDTLKQTARMLASKGVNLVRMHGAMFDSQGAVDREKISYAMDVVEAMKKEGIYTHFSIYFPLWLKPKPDWDWLPGYDSAKHPFAALMFHKPFEERYRSWWKALLTTPHPATGRRLIDEPAVFGAEIQNEDSFFFWTFSDKNIPEPLLQSLESQFGAWLIQKHGSIEKALQHWDGLRIARDQPAQGRMGFRPLWAIGNERKKRDQDTAQFLLETQRNFYRRTYAFLRSLGFKGLIHASNWNTAQPEILGPLEKWSYLEGDFVDRHGYFGCFHKGPNSEWSIRDGHTYADRSALRFDPEQPGKPKQFNHPVIDIHYGGKPSMISETTFTRPNRYRSEAPLYYAAYGALQDTDAEVHFALDGEDWNVKPGYFMQPWTLMSPAMAGQFPGAALLYRTHLIQTGRVSARVQLNPSDLLALHGTPLPQDASFDELRLKDVPEAGKSPGKGQRLDPLLHFVGKSEVTFDASPSSSTLGDSSAFIHREAGVVESNTGELKLNYKKGTLELRGQKAQGLSGNLQQAGSTDLGDIIIDSTLETGHILLVPLDNQPLRESKRMLLQVMSEEKASGFKTLSQTNAPQVQVQVIQSIGQNPWLIRKLSGSVRLKPSMGGALRVTALDFNGIPTAPLGTLETITLQPGTLYYTLER